MMKNLLLLIATLMITSAVCSQTAEKYFYAGIKKAKTQDLQGAIADFTKAIEIDPYLMEAYHNRGTAKDKLKDFQGALADFTKVIEINPIDANAYCNRGIVKDELKDYQGALVDLTKNAATTLIDLLVKAGKLKAKEIENKAELFRKLESCFCDRAGNPLKFEHKHLSYSKDNTDLLQQIITSL
jgi:tetratricopeptide (TPR) repeat protein